MQSQGTLTDTDLASLLKTLQDEHSTGKLDVTSGEQNCSLHFLFGHLFHAVSADTAGDDAALTALKWADGDFSFDPRAKLPAEENISLSPEELIALSEGTSPSMPDETNEKEWAAMSTDDDWATHPAVTVDPEETTPTLDKNMSSDKSTSALAESEAALQKESVEKKEKGKKSVLGSPVAPPLNLFYPIPTGTAVYSALKNDFIDFAKLLKTLQGDARTGYVSLVSANTRSLLLFNGGNLFEALSQKDNGHIVHGETAFAHFREFMSIDGGTFDVMELEADIVTSYVQLITGELFYTGLLGRFIDFGSLLEYLKEERVEGSVVVVGSTDVGVIMLHGGTVLGAYTDSSRITEVSVETVSKIAQENSSRIEVKRATEPSSPMDVESLLKKR